MAALIPSASATGSGTMTLAGPSTNSNQTVSIPDATGTMMVSGNMPAFSYTQSTTTTLSANTFTKITLGTKDFDTNNNVSSSTFTATIAGYYQINGLVVFNATATTGVNILCSLYKNGSRYKDGSFGPVNNLQGGWTNVSSVVYMNGSTDTIELYAYINNIASLGTQTGLTFLNGALIRAA